MYPDRRKPIVANEVAFRLAVRYMCMCFRINVPLREPKVDHVYDVAICALTEYAVTQLDVSMQNAAHMHEL